MKIIRFILGWGFITFLLLISVVGIDLIFSGTQKNAETPAAPASALYSNRTLLLGFISDALRALLLCYLYPQLKFAGLSVWSSVKFGLCISAIMSTLWLVFGYFELKLEDPDHFLVVDSIIFVVQGVASGLGLHLAFKKKLIYHA